MRDDRRGGGQEEVAVAGGGYNQNALDSGMFKYFLKKVLVSVWKSLPLLLPFNFNLENVSNTQMTVVPGVKLQVWK